MGPGFHLCWLAPVTHVLHPTQQLGPQLGFDVSVLGVVRQVVPLVGVGRHIVEFFAGTFLVSPDLLGRIAITARGPGLPGPEDP